MRAIPWRLRHTSGPGFPPTWKRSSCDALQRRQTIDIRTPEPLGRPLRTALVAATGTTSGPKSGGSPRLVPSRKPWREVVREKRQFVVIPRAGVNEAFRFALLPRAEPGINGLTSWGRKLSRFV